MGNTIEVSSVVEFEHELIGVDVLGNAFAKVECAHALSLNIECVNESRVDRIVSKFCFPNVVGGFDSQVYRFSLLSVTIKGHFLKWRD